MTTLSDDKWFRVEVSDGEGQIVAIESEMLCGRDIGEHEQETIIRAIRHLQGFIGADALEAAEARIKELELQYSLIPHVVHEGIVPLAATPAGLPEEQKGPGDANP